MRGAVRDVRLFSNSLDRTVDLARKAGILLEQERAETEKEVIFTIRLTKKEAETPAGVRVGLLAK